MSDKFPFAYVTTVFLLQSKFYFSTRRERCQTLYTCLSRPPPPPPFFPRLSVLTARGRRRSTRPIHGHEILASGVMAAGWPLVTFARCFESMDCRSFITLSHGYFCCRNYQFSELYPILSFILRNFHTNTVLFTGKRNHKYYNFFSDISSLGVSK